MRSAAHYGMNNYAPDLKKSPKSEMIVCRCKHIKDCVYRSSDRMTCDYILKEKHARGCDPANCDKYKSMAK